MYGHLEVRAYDVRCAYKAPNSERSAAAVEWRSRRDDVRWREARGGRGGGEERESEGGVVRARKCRHYGSSGRFEGFQEAACRSR